ncbi:hypothetical protein KIPB_000238 [Kipferlia bialata]|uniref:Uncharacterized protein n=1 Tax=Kipferlia bialata TaxID=797122 RepID=A0A9K3GEI7_9EUKA|nr:hypothetical protein KIPB_000238 [Kipferlia bialata]|eukprot:g238.t1
MAKRYFWVVHAPVSGRRRVLGDTPSEGDAPEKAFGVGEGERERSIRLGGGSKGWGMASLLRHIQFLCPTPSPVPSSGGRRVRTARQTPPGRFHVGRWATSVLGEYLHVLLGNSDGALRHLTLHVAALATRGLTSDAWTELPAPVFRAESLCVVRVHSPSPMMLVIGGKRHLNQVHVFTPNADGRGDGGRWKFCQLSGECGVKGKKGKVTFNVDCHSVCAVDPASVLLLRKKGAPILLQTGDAARSTCCVVETPPDACSPTLHQAVSLGLEPQWAARALCRSHEGLEALCTLLQRVRDGVTPVDTGHSSLIDLPPRSVLAVIMAVGVEFASLTELLRVPMTVLIEGGVCDGAEGVLDLDLVCQYLSEAPLCAPADSWLGPRLLAALHILSLDVVVSLDTPGEASPWQLAITPLLPFIRGACKRVGLCERITPGLSSTPLTVSVTRDYHEAPSHMVSLAPRMALSVPGESWRGSDYDDRETAQLEGVLRTLESHAVERMVPVPATIPLALVGGVTWVGDQLLLVEGLGDGNEYDSRPQGTQVSVVELVPGTLVCKATEVISTTPSSGPQRRHACITSCLHNQLVLVGGQSSDESVGYEPICHTDAWTKGPTGWGRLPSLPFPLVGSSAVSHGSDLHVVGLMADWTESPKRHLRLSADGRWVSLARPPFPARHPILVAVGPFILAVVSGGHREPNAVYPYHVPSDTWIERGSLSVQSDFMNGVGQLTDVDTVSMETDEGRILLSLPDSLIECLGGEYLQQTSAQLHVHPGLLAYRLARRLKSTAGVLEGCTLQGEDGVLCSLGVEVAELVSENTKSESEGAVSSLATRLMELLCTVTSVVSTQGQQEAGAGYTKRGIVLAYLLGALTAAYPTCRVTSQKDGATQAWLVYVAAAVARWEREIEVGVSSSLEGTLALPDYASMATFTTLVANMIGQGAVPSFTPQYLSPLEMASVMATACVALPLYTPLWHYMYRSHSSLDIAEHAALDLSAVTLVGVDQGENMRRLLDFLHSMDLVLPDTGPSVVFNHSTPDVCRNVIVSALLAKHTTPSCTVTGTTHEPKSRVLPLIGEVVRESRFGDVTVLYHRSGVEGVLLPEVMIDRAAQESRGRVLRDHATLEGVRFMLPVSENTILCVGRRNGMYSNEGTIGFLHRAEDPHTHNLTHSWESLSLDQSPIPQCTFSTLLITSTRPVLVGGSVYFCITQYGDVPLQLVVLDLATREWTQTEGGPDISSVFSLGVLQGCVCVVGRVGKATQVWAYDDTDRSCAGEWACLSAGLPCSDQCRHEPALGHETAIALPCHGKSQWGDFALSFTKIDEGLRVGVPGASLKEYLTSVRVGRHVVGLFKVHAEYDDALDREVLGVRVCLCDRVTGEWLPLATVKYPYDYTNTPSHVLPLGGAGVVVVLSGMYFVEVDFPEALLEF